MNFFKNLSRRSRTLVFVFIAIVAATLAWRKGFVGLTDSHAQRTERTSAVAAPDNRSESDAVDLTEKQAEAVKIGPVGSRDFAVLKTAVGTIDFNENLLVQVFSQYKGKIIKANFNIGDDVKAGDVLFTIDSPDLLAGGIDLACAPQACSNCRSER